MFLYIMVSTMMWVGAFSPPLFPLGSSGKASSLGRELAPPRTGAATALILCRQQAGKSLESCNKVRCRRLRGYSTHLNKWPVGLDDLDDDHHGDADHGGQGQSPAERDGPVGVLVDLVVRQRLVLDQREDEAALDKRRKCRHDTGTFCTCLSRS